MEFEFENDFLSDNEIDELTDSIVLGIAAEIENDESRTSIVNPPQIRKLSLAYRLLNDTFINEDVSISYKLHDPFQSMGSISVTGADITARQTNSFARAVELSSNVDIYPKVDGTVCMTFTFHNLTIPLE